MVYLHETMDFNKTVDLIIRDLEEAAEIINDLKNFPGAPAIQIEMAKAKCRNAAEIIALFKDQRDVKQAGRENEPAASGPVKKDPDASEFIIPVKTGEEAANARKGAQKKPEQESDNRNQSSGIIADRFENLPDSINSKLGSMIDDTVVPGYLRSNPLLTLSQAIGINDRFLFIRELFNGDADSYNKAVSGIDEAQSLSDARALILTITGDKSETEAGRQFFDLVKRKFPADE